MRTREASKFMTINRVCDCDLNFFQTIQDIKLRNIYRVVTIDETRVLENDKVEPTTTSSSAGCRTIFLTYFLEISTNFLVTKVYEYGAYRTYAMIYI